MTDLGLFALLWLVSEYSHLLGLAVLDDLSLNCCACYVGCAYGEGAVVVYGDDLVA